MNDDEVQEQIAYYRRRAPDYDEEAAFGEGLVSYSRQIDAALETFRPAGHVLEIACGTGNGTRRLLEQATKVTALDSSPEVIELARKKLQDDPRVHYILADVFDWEPAERYDVVYFRFWLTHVPLARFDRFWDLVREALKPGGRVFFEDDMKGSFKEQFVSETPGVVSRSTSDGRTFRVVKVYWDPEELDARLSGLGWDIKIQTAGPFMWGAGTHSG